jgi:peptidoglycan hydrolase-like protein with peptidoglycan-binding domain
MTAFTGGEEPDLAVGDQNESVTQLQTRLQALGRFDAMIDGHFGDLTEAAVKQLQEDSGLEPTGTVDAATRHALADAEQRAGLHDPYAGPDPSAPPVGTLSEDQHWRWDGDGWQPNEEWADAADRVGGDPGGGQLSADGQWLWDGNQWQPATQ